MSRSPFVVIRSRRQSLIRPMALAAAVAFVTSGQAMAQTWTGASAANSNWTTVANWTVAPANNGTANLVFDGVNRLTNNVDVPFNVRSITFAANAAVNEWAISGSSLSIGVGGITNNNNDAATVSTPITLTAATLFATSNSGPIGALTLGSAANPVTLGAFDLVVSAGNGAITFPGRIVGTGGISKSGAGTATFSGTASNAYTGATTVSGGLLVLAKPEGVAGNSFGSALAGSLNINSGRVQLGASEQIRDTATVTVGTEGTFDLLTNTETIAALVGYNGAVVRGGTVASQILFLPTAGHLIRVESNLSLPTGDLQLVGDLEFYGSLLPSPQTYVHDQPGIIYAFGSNALTGGSVSLAIADGTLLLGRSSVNSFSGSLAVSGGTVSYFGSNQLADDTALTISAGTFSLGGNSDTIGAFTMSGGSTSPNPFGLLTATSFALSGGTLATSFVVKNNATFSGGTAQGASITVSGTYTGTATDQLVGVLTVNGAATVGANNTLRLAGNGISDFRGGLSGTNATLNVQSSAAHFRSHAALSGFSTITGAGTFENRGTWTLDAPTTTFTNSGTNLNTGSMVLGVGTTLNFPFSSATFRNAGSIQLNAGFIVGPTTLTNAVTGSITGPGNLNVAKVVNDGTVSVPAGSFLSVTTALDFINNGHIRVFGGTGQLAGSLIQNKGRISGDGLVTNTIVNNPGGRIEPGPGGTLTLASTLQTQPGSTLAVPATSTLLALAGSTNGQSNGLISLTGGTLDFAANSLTNSATGQITGYGTLAAANLRNSGSITFTGGTTTLNTPLTNDAARSLRVQFNPAIFTSFVTNNGIFTLTGTNATFAGGSSGASAGIGGNANIGGNASAGGTVALAGTGTTTVSPGAQLLSDGIVQASLTLQGSLASPSSVLIQTRQPTGAVELGGRTVSQSLSILGSLTVASDNAPLPTRHYFATIDLADNDLILQSADPATDLSTLHAMARDYLDAAPLGGIGSSLAVPGVTGLAIFQNSAQPEGGSIPFYSTYAGAALAASDILVKYTYIGDTNLDGLVTAADLTNAIEGYSTGATGWRNGDFNYDGFVTTTDIQALLANLNSAPFGTLAAPSTSTNPNGGAIPEPAAALYLVPALPLLARRRRPVPQA